MLKWVLPASLLLLASGAQANCGFFEDSLELRFAYEGSEWGGLDTIQGKPMDAHQLHPQFVFYTAEETAARRVAQAFKNAIIEKREGSLQGWAIRMNSSREDRDVWIQFISLLEQHQWKFSKKLIERAKNASIDELEDSNRWYQNQS